VLAAKMDMRSLFWPKGGSEWKVALKKAGKARSKGLLRGNGNGFHIFSEMQWPQGKDHSADLYKKQFCTYKN